MAANATRAACQPKELMRCCPSGAMTSVPSEPAGLAALLRRSGARYRADENAEPGPRGADAGEEACHLERTREHAGETHEQQSRRVDQRGHDQHRARTVTVGRGANKGLRQPP